MIDLTSPTLLQRTTIIITLYNYNNRNGNGNILWKNYATIMMLSSYYYGNDSVSTIESSRCRERKQFEQQLSKLLSENASLINTVKLMSNELQVKEDEMLEMQEAHEIQMLGMLKTKLSNTNVSISTSVSCHRRNNDSPSHQRELPKAKANEVETKAKAAKATGQSKSSNKTCWCKIKSEMSYCGRSVLSKIKMRPLSLGSIPKVVSFPNTPEVENMSTLTC